jgi:thioredoxin 1
MSEHIVQIDSASFDTAVVASATPVLVDFWAPWCGPCKMIAPLLEELATEFAGQVGFTKVNVDDNGDLAAKYAVRAIPTLLLFKGGQVVGQFVGMMDKATLKAKISAAL